MFNVFICLAITLYLKQPLSRYQNSCRDSMFSAVPADPLEPWPSVREVILTTTQSTRIITENQRSIRQYMALYWMLRSKSINRTWEWSSFASSYARPDENLFLNFFCILSIFHRQTLNRSNIYGGVALDQYIVYRWATCTCICLTSSLYCWPLRLYDLVWRCHDLLPLFTIPMGRSGVIWTNTVLCWIKFFWTIEGCRYRSFSFKHS